MQDLTTADCPNHLSRHNRQVKTTSDSHSFIFKYNVYNSNACVVSLTYSYIVTGDTEGHIIFYDEGFKLLIRYVEYNLDAIISISFSKEFTVGPLENYSPQAEEHIIR